jgi:hypothetical protein
MATTQDDIRAWIKRAPEGATHMLVICDTFDWSDYPKFVMPGEDVRKLADQSNGPNMTKLMEVYNLSMDLEPQITSHRAFNY